MIELRGERERWEARSFGSLFLEYYVCRIRAMQWSKNLAKASQTVYHLLQERKKGPKPHYLIPDFRLILKFPLQKSLMRQYIPGQLAVFLWLSPHRSSTSVAILKELLEMLTKLTTGSGGLMVSISAHLLLCSEFPCQLLLEAKWSMIKTFGNYWR